MRALFLGKETNELDKEQHSGADTCQGIGQQLAKPCDGKAEHGEGWTLPPGEHSGWWWHSLSFPDVNVVAHHHHYISMTGKYTPGFHQKGANKHPSFQGLPAEAETMTRNISTANGLLYIYPFQNCSEPRAWRRATLIFFHSSSSEEECLGSLYQSTSCCRWSQGCCLAPAESSNRCMGHWGTGQGEAIPVAATQDTGTIVKTG